MMSARATCLLTYQLTTSLGCSGQKVTDGKTKVRCRYCIFQEKNSRCAIFNHRRYGDKERKCIDYIGDCNEKTPTKKDTQKHGQ